MRLPIAALPKLGPAFMGLDATDDWMTRFEPCIMLGSHKAQMRLLVRVIVFRSHVRIARGTDGVDDLSASILVVRNRLSAL